VLLTGTIGPVAAGPAALLGLVAGVLADLLGEVAEAGPRAVQAVAVTSVTRTIISAAVPPRGTRPPPGRIDIPPSCRRAGTGSAGSRTTAR
jgi:hypothetical protein